MSTQLFLQLDSLHRNAKAVMVPFAGYSMPLNYGEGLLQEHLHTRNNASLFDVSHMGKLRITGEDALSFLNYLLPIPSERLAIGKARYTVMLNKNAGIIDDLVLTRTGEAEFLMIINAACIEKDLKHINSTANEFSSLSIKQLTEHCLLALQGPKAASVAGHLFSNQKNSIESLAFMAGTELSFQNTKLWINRCGYTGEDGFELLVPGNIAESIAKELLSDERVKPAGLGARDSLRLEAGLPLYGDDMDEGTTVYEAAVGFVISKLRKENKNNERDFIGAEATRVASQQAPKKQRVGIRPSGKALLRKGTLLYADNAMPGDAAEDTAIGKICSGGYAPSLKGPIAFAYIEQGYVNNDTVLYAPLRNKMEEVTVCALPFVPHKYKR